MDNRRFFLWAALAAILLMLYTSWQETYGPKPQPAAETTEAGRIVPGQTGSAGKDAPPPSAGATAPANPPKQTTAAAMPEAALTSSKRVRVTTDLLDVTIDTHGGDIRSAKLRQYPIELHKKDDPFELLTEDTNKLLIAQSGLLSYPLSLAPYHNNTYRASRGNYVLVDGQDSLDVVLTWNNGKGVAFDKVFRFTRNSYTVRVFYRVTNRSASKWMGQFYGRLQGQAIEQQTGLFRLPTFTGGAIYTKEDQYDKIKFEDMAKKDLLLNTESGWAAMMQHYFVASWMSAPDQPGKLFTQKVSGNRYAIGYVVNQHLQVAPGKTGEIGMDLFVGPKEAERLERLPEGMDLVVDFGALTFIAAPLYWLLSIIEDFIGNWGWAIIALTILLKAAFYPLNNTSYKSMANMRRLQPKLAELKTKYGNDKTRYNQAMMELYKTEKLNPMTGCLPMIVQIPVFIALYWVLLESVEMRQAPFALWIHDLSAPDPYFVLPVLMGLSMFATTWLSPATDPMQRKIFMAMPVVMTAFFLFFPSGLVLYWFINNVLQFIQQWYITKQIEAKKH